MIHSLSLRFYLNKDKEKGGKCPIYFRIIVSRKKAEVATMFAVPIKEWDDDKQRTKKNTQINEELSSLETEVYEIVKKLEKEEKEVSASNIKDHLIHKDKIDPFLLSFYDDYVKRLEKSEDVGEARIRHYNKTRDYISDFLQESKKEEMRVKSVNYKFIFDFDSFLSSLKDKKGKKMLGKDTIAKHHSRLRTIIISAKKQEYVKKNPYEDFKLKEEGGKRTFLLQEEIDGIIQHNLGDNDSLKRVRDIFIFSVYTGLRFEDAQQLKMDKIAKTKKGDYTLQMDQEKTDVPLSVPLFKPAIDIIEKYFDCDERKVFNKVLPKISNQKINVYLKVIAELVGITKTLTHHVARHTCATTILLENEVDLIVVSKWLGHLDIRTTQKYAKVTNKLLRKVATRVENELFEK